MHPLDPAIILKAMLECRETGPVPACPPSLRFIPDQGDPFRLRRYGRLLETPLGAAAGPHTQLCQNIVCAWQAGARYLELKTVQKLDRIRVPRPCIDMRNEGYNCEWSQELSLDQSYREYMHAYVLIHILRRAWGHAGAAEGEGEGPGFLFNMSAGYDLEGVKSRPMQQFFDRMADARKDMDALLCRLAPLCPEARDLALDPRLSDNLTLSTMHGCPPEEIERLCRHFLEERHVHTTLKLNPTLLGPEETRALLADLGYDLEIEDDSFQRDLHYDEALDLIRSLSAAGKRAGRQFHVKLTNTLPVRNKGTSLPPSETLVYLSGHALHPLAVALGAKLQQSFGGLLDLSFSAGISAKNAADALACGLWPLTLCSDLLRPGGYTRLHAMLEALRETMRAKAAGSPRALVLAVAGQEEYADNSGAEHSGEDELARARLGNIRLYARRCAHPAGPFAKKPVRPLRKKAAASPEARTDASGFPQCDLHCGVCVGVCPNRANFFARSPGESIGIPLLRRERGGVRVEYAGEVPCGKAVRVLHLADLCNQCGNCAGFCPSSEPPFRAKARLFLSPEAFAASERGVLLEPRRMIFKGDGTAFTLAQQDCHLIFEDERARLMLTCSSARVVDARLKAGHTEALLDNAAFALLIHHLTREIRALLGSTILLNADRS